MENLIKALQIFLKYANEKFPTNCTHDTLYVCGIHKDDVSPEDIKELDDLGFFWDDYTESFASNRFGSC